MAKYNSLTFAEAMNLETMDSEHPFAMLTDPAKNRIRDQLDIFFGKEKYNEQPFFDEIEECE